MFFEGWVISSFDTVYPYCVEGERASVPARPSHSSRPKTSPMDAWPMDAGLHFAGWFDSDALVPEPTGTEPTHTGPIDARPMDPHEFGEWLQAASLVAPAATGHPRPWEDPATIDLATINANLQKSCRRLTRDGLYEPLIHVPLDYDDWHMFWDWANVDEDERERMMCATWPGTVWPYLGEAVSTARNLLMAASRAESEETRQRLDQLVGRLHRLIFFHRLQNRRTRFGAPAPGTPRRAPTNPMAPIKAQD